MEGRNPFSYRQLVETETFRRLSTTRDYLAAHHGRVITLEEAAKEACMSPFHYQRMFKRAFGESPHDFVTRLRIERAQRLLRTSGMSVTEVCFEVGYESLGSFSTMFSRVVGCAPSEFRRVYSIPTRWFLRNVPTCMFGWGNPVRAQESRSAF